MPDSLRLLPRFFSAMIATKREYRIRLFGRFPRGTAYPTPLVTGSGQPVRGNPGIGPRSQPGNRGGKRPQLDPRLSSLRARADRASWGGLIDTTPDAVPVIAPVLKAPWILPHERVFRPWFWHRTRCRTSDGRVDHRAGRRWSIQTRFASNASPHMQGSPDIPHLIYHGGLLTVLKQYAGNKTMR